VLYAQTEKAYLKMGESFYRNSFFSNQFFRKTNIDSIKTEDKKNNKEKQKSYHVSFLIGKIDSYNNRNDAKLSSFSFSPSPGLTGFSFDYWLVDGIGSNREKVAFFVPSVILQNNYGGIKFGCNLIKIIETDDGPDHLIIPAVGIRMGDLEKLYFEFDVFSDIFSFPYSFKANYIFNNSFSSIMVGFYFGGDESENNYGFTGKINWQFYRRFNFILHGRGRDTKATTAFRLGIGYVL